MVMELTEPTTDLDGLAEMVHAAWSAARNHQITAWEGYLQVGGLLLEARTRLTADREYGHWLEAQEFGFSRQWANRLVRLAENRPAVTAALESALSTGSNPPGVDTLLAMLVPPRLEATPARPLNYDPDHHASVVVWLVVNFKLNPTLREKGKGHAAGADRGEWQTEITMGTPMPDSAVELDPFADELTRQFKQKVREDPFLTMLR
jgi:hypothetical protein